MTTFLHHIFDFSISNFILNRIIVHFCLKMIKCNFDAISGLFRKPKKPPFPIPSKPLILKHKIPSMDLDNRKDLDFSNQ